MRRALPPLLLVAPSRYATATPGTARCLLMALIAMILLAGMAASVASPVAPDHALANALLDAVRAGGSYYPVAADALRSGGNAAVTVPLPTLTVTATAMPDWLLAGLLYLLAAAVLVAWHDRLREALRTPSAQLGGAVLVIAGALAVWRGGAAASGEVWAGLFIALSLARWRPDRWVEAIGWGLAAALIREAASVYLLAMAALAWRDGDRRQALGWAAALAIAALVFAIHLRALAEVNAIASLLPAWQPTGILQAGVLALLPLPVAAAVAALAWAGWTAWRHPLAVRAAAVVVAFALLGGPAAQLAAPLLLLGLAFLPDGVRDLAAAALDRRRILVRRVTP